METIGKFFTGLILLVINILINGFLLSTFWKWFIVDTFKNVHPISILQAIGLSLIVRWVVTTPKKEKDFTFKNFIKKFITSLLLAAFMLFIGWLIHLFY